MPNLLTYSIMRWTFSLSNVLAFVRIHHLSWYMMAHKSPCDLNMKNPESITQCAQ